MSIKQFTFGAGLILLAICVLGFFPMLLTPSMMPDDGLLFGLFAVNWLQNTIHIVLGLWALVASKDVFASHTFCKASSIIFAVVVLLGLIPTLNTLYGILPMYGHNVWLNAIFALSTGYFGYVWGYHRTLATSKH